VVRFNCTHQVDVQKNKGNTMLYYNSIPEFKNVTKVDVKNRKEKRFNCVFFAIGINKKGEQLFLSKSKINNIRKLFPDNAKINIENKKLLIEWSRSKYQINLVDNADLKRGHVNGIKVNWLR